MNNKKKNEVARISIIFCNLENFNEFQILKSKLKYNSKKNISTWEEVLEILIKDHEILQLLKNESDFKARKILKEIRNTESEIDQK